MNITKDDSKITSVKLAASPPNYFLPERFANLKRDIATSIPNFQQRVTQAWREVLADLATRTEEIAKAGPDVCTRIS
jgi:hypothetical protein